MEDQLGAICAAKPGPETTGHSRRRATLNPSATCARRGKRSPGKIGAAPSAGVRPLAFQVYHVVQLADRQPRYSSSAKSRRRLRANITRDARAGHRRRARQMIWPEPSRIDRGLAGRTIARAVRSFHSLQLRRRRCLQPDLQLGDPIAQLRRERDIPLSFLIRRSRNRNSDTSIRVVVERLHEISVFIGNDIG